jgi:hypothetical protein
VIAAVLVLLQEAWQRDVHPASSLTAARTSRMSTTSSIAPAACIRSEGDPPSERSLGFMLLPILLEVALGATVLEIVASVGRR